MHFGISVDRGQNGKIYFSNIFVRREYVSKENLFKEI